MRLKLVELQARNSQARKIKVEKLSGNCKDSNKIWYYKGLVYHSEIIQTKLISMDYDYLLVSFFGIKKTQKVIA